MESNINDRMKKRHDNRILAGVLLLVAGVIYLFNQINVFFLPTWMFSWPMAFIVIGLAMGYRHNFRNIGWLYMVLFGGVFLADMIFPGIQGMILFPSMMILLGVRMLFFKEGRFCRERWERRHEWRTNWYEQKPDPTSL